MAQSDPESTRDALASFTNTNRAVTPVIGVVLLVLVTVALAGIVSTLIFGLTDGMSQSAPNADVAFQETADGAIVVTHAGGDTLDRGTVEVVYTNQTGSTVREPWLTPVQAGDSPESSPFNVKAGTTIRVVWTSPDGGQSYTVGVYETAV